MAKNKPPAFQFYPDAWLSSTSIALMSLAETGAFLNLLCHAWMAEDCGLPDDDEQLAILSRLGKQWPKSSKRLRDKFEVIGDRLFNPRLVEERVKQQEWKRKSAEGGKHSAATKAQAKLKGGSRVVEEWLQPNGKPREEEEEEVSSVENLRTFPSSKRTVDSPSYEDLALTWNWFASEYPGDVNEFIDRQLFLSVMETPEDIALLRENVPLWKNARGPGFHKTAKNFLSERTFKTKPKARDSPATEHKSIYRSTRDLDRETGLHNG